MNHIRRFFEAVPAVVWSVVVDLSDLGWHLVQCLSDAGWYFADGFAALGRAVLDR